ncbi:gamma-glutamyl-gamma-aminobutyrate hydrolase family protein [soil metagenome]
MTAPLIAITTWRRSLPTYLGSATDLYTLGSEYAEAVHAAGGIPVLLPALGPEEVERVLDSVDGVLLSGGQDLGLSPAPDAERDATEFALLAGARQRGIPVFGICRGLQAINVFLGGTLVDDLAATTAHPALRDDDDRSASRHRVTTSVDWIAAALEEDGVVNSIHHQAIDELADGLEAVAWAPDDTIEAIEGTDPGWFLRAVQWHPEKLRDATHSTRLLSDFISRSTRPAPSSTQSALHS